MNASATRPLIRLTGAMGNTGQSLAADFASHASVDLALYRVRQALGGHIARVVHLVTYFDFSNADDPSYQGGF